MTTAAAFNEMMNQFLGELATVFPDEKAIQDAKANPWSKDDFMKAVNPWSTQMMQKDDAFWVEDNVLAKGLNMHVIWKTEDCTANTKNAIWQYLQSLYMIATTMNMFPPDTLAMIEAAAEKCAKNFQGGEGPSEDALHGMLAQMLGGAGGGANPLAALLGGTGPAQPRAQRRAANRKKKSSK